MSWPCLLQVLILVWSINTLVTTSSSNESDRLALLAFKDMLSDPVGALSSWNDSLHYCEWNGVTCSHRHLDRVTAIDLESQQLEGILSPHIGNLSFLQKIVLTENNFQGQIPQEIGRLFRLQDLRLNNNSFSGEIPVNLTYCSNLRGFSFIDNQLSGRIPVELTTLPKLAYFGIAKNKLYGTIPLSLANLSSLTFLAVGQNNLEGNIPHELCCIHNLYFFDVGLNNLTGEVPMCLYNLSRVTQFAINDNQLYGGLPRDIGVTLPNLRGLIVGRNQFTGPIPVTLSNASGLQIISLEENMFTGSVPNDLGKLQNLSRLFLLTNQLGTAFGDDLNFINSLTNCSNLEMFEIPQNFLNGSVPNSIANLSTTVTFLTFGENEIYGSIPPGIESLVNLNILGFDFNHLSGKIPQSVGMMPNLHGLYLARNQLSGELPDFCNNSTQLSILSLSDNKLSGRIPLSLANCMSLSALDLSDNNFDGTIPQEVIGLSSLTIVMNLSNNALSSILPSTVGNLSSLQALDFSRNRLSGHIPDTLGDCLTLEYLHMEDNSFEGNIPESLSALRGLQELDLSRNKFSGEIPKYLMNFSALNYLNLSYNEFEGSVPEGGAFRNASAVSVVGNSKLCGGAVEFKLLPCKSQTFKKGRRRRNSLFIKVLVPAVFLGLCLVILSCLLFYRRKSSNVKHVLPSLFRPDQYIRISYAELVKATDSFSTDNLIGVGSYGSVYKGILDQVNTIVAVKVFNLQQRGASKSFLSECKALRHARHRNIIKIITSCSSMDFQGNNFQALVFAYMPNGSLEEWLHSKGDEQYVLRNLNFLQRLNIAIDVASALDYLHHHCQPTIIHGDLKPGNVLLDDDMTAHVTDFGLAKIFSAASSAASCNSSESQMSSVVVKGSIGYIVPEYGMGGNVSMEGDVYSYGVLVLEMFTGKRPTDDTFHDGHNLHSFCKMNLSEHVMNIVDPSLLIEGSGESISIKKQRIRLVQMQESVVSTIKLGVACSVDRPNERKNMGEVLTELYHIRDRYLGVNIE